MWKGNAVKFKKDNPNYWNIDEDKSYIVQDSCCKGSQHFIILRNEKGKLRKYYEHLFEELKIVEPKDKKEIKTLKEIWFKDDSEESKQAYEKLKELDGKWKSDMNLGKGVKVIFASGVEKDRFKDRIFVCQKEPVFDTLFSGYIKLKGLYGCYDVEKLKVVK